MNLFSSIVKDNFNIAKDVLAFSFNSAKFAFTGSLEVSQQLVSDLERRKHRKAFLATSSQPFSHYQYQELPPGEKPTIRIIRLLPGNDWDDIECILEISGLHDVAYDALSYCWGDPGELTQIICNGHHFEVTHNLKLALNNLRLPNRERILWADAICINQKNVSEREQQVSIMGDIYRHAQQTIVYLGEPSIFGKMTFGILENLYQQYNDLKNGRLNFSEAKGQSHTLVVNHGKAPIPLLYGLLITHIFQTAPWFTRMWVLQEAALSRDVLVICGRQEIKWEVFAKGTLVKILYSLHNVFGRELSSELDRTLLRLIALREGVVSRTQNLGLLALLNQVRELNSADPRDKVYAIFGLTDSNLAQMGLRPDYGITAKQLYTDVALALLHGSASLDLLSVPRSNSKLSQELPSWVPDWSGTADYTRPLVPQQESETFQHNSKAFCASGTSKPLPVMVIRNESDSETENSRMRLKLRGYVFNRVTHLAKQTPKAEAVHEEFLRQVASSEVSIQSLGQILTKLTSWKAKEWKMQFDWWSFLKNMPGAASRFQLCPGSEGIYSPTGEKSEVAFMRTLCADYMPYKEEDMVQSFRVWITTGARRVHGMWSQLTRFNIPFPGIQSDAIDFSGMMEMMIGRCLMWSEGGYLGLVPAMAREGDAIVLIQGCRVPLVLRETTNGAWQLVGDCFVHGVMYGEKFDESKCGEIILE